MASRGSSAKSKGADQERKIAKMLSDWWGEPFQRTPGSGSLHWSEDNRVSGDIVPTPDSTFNLFSVEVKFHNSTNLSQLVTSSGEFPSFWRQCTGDAEQFNKVPMLIFKMLRVKPWVVLPYSSKLFSYAIGSCPVVHTVLSYKNIRKEQQNFEVVALPLDKLISLVDPDNMIKLYKDCHWI